MAIFRQQTNLCSERSPKLPSGWINWTKDFYKVPDITALNYSSLDGYLFLRYLKIVCIICGVGCIIVWPVLIPLHILGGVGDKQLDLLTFGNVAHPSWYFAHAFLAWIYFGKSRFRDQISATDTSRLHSVHGVPRMRLLYQSSTGLPALAVLCQSTFIPNGTIHLCPPASSR